MKASGTIGLTNMKLKMKDMPDVDIKKVLFTFTPISERTILQPTAGLKTISATH